MSGLVNLLNISFCFFWYFALEGFSYINEIIIE